MRVLFLTLFALAVFFVNVLAVPVPSDMKAPPEPTAKQLDAAKEAYAKHGAEHETMTDPSQTLHVFRMPFKTTTDADLKGLPNLPFRFGLCLHNCYQVTDTGLRELKDLKNLTFLTLYATQMTDAGLKELKDLKNLTILDVQGTELTGEGLKELKQLKKLRILGFGSTKVTHAGLKEIKELKSLTTLILDDTQVTDEGAMELKELKNLTLLSLERTKVTNAGLSELKKALPTCRISK